MSDAFMYNILYFLLGLMLGMIINAILFERKDKKDRNDKDGE